MKKVIFKYEPNKNLGDALFKYLACVLFALEYNLEYTYEDIIPEIEEYKFIMGKDHSGDDKYHFKNTLYHELKEIANLDLEVQGFNTLGFLKKQINFDKLESNDWINEKKRNGLFYKNVTIISNKNYDKFNSDINFNNIKLIGNFKFENIYTKSKNKIIEYIELNKHNHFIRYDKESKINVDKIINNDDNTLIDIVVHLDFFKTDDDNIEFIKKEYLEEIFKNNNKIFFNKKVCLLYEKSNQDILINYVNDVSQFFCDNHINFSIQPNNPIENFKIMSNSKIIICSLNSCCWISAYLSKVIEYCYMPNYNNFEKKIGTTFKKPIFNTILYDIDI